MLDALHLIVDILSCEAQLLVEHLIWSRESETAKTPDLTFVTWNETFEVNRQTSCETELLHTSREHLCLIVGRLSAEESFRWYTNDRALDAVLTEEFCTSYEGRNLRTRCNQNDVWVGITTSYNVCTLSSLSIVVSFWEVGDVLT